MSRLAGWSAFWPVVGALCAAPALADEAPGASAPLSIAAAHSALKFQLFAPPRVEDGSTSAALLAQAQRIVASLEKAAVTARPEAMARIGRFEVYIADADSMAAQSSATGRIALNAAFAASRPTDDWLAFVLAREMAHVLAGHHADNSTASIVASVLMNLVVPGTGIVKTALSFVGSQAAAVSGRERQLGEADALALDLLDAAGFSRANLALSLALGPSEAALGASSWGRAFAQSARSLVARVRGTPAAVPEVAQVAQVAQVEPQLAPLAVALAPQLSLDARTETVVRRPPPEDIVLRTRPSGLPGMLILGGQFVPGRRIE